MSPVDPVDRSPSSAPSANPDARRRLLLALGAALILVGLAVGAWALLPSGGGPATGPAPSTSASLATTPSPGAASTADAPGAAPEDTTTPPLTDPPAPEVEGAPMVTAFDVSPAIATCADERESEVPLTFSWASSGADRAWIGVATSDASVQPFAEVPTASDGYTEIAYACRDAEQLFTLTVQGAGGTVSMTLTVVRQLD